jgi:hypothetical protein
MGGLRTVLSIGQGWEEVNFIESIKDGIAKIRASSATAVSEIPLVRTGGFSLVDGVVIDGCDLCSHNYSRKASRFLPIPTHYCNSRIDDKANDKVIYDPLNIPADCPFRLKPEQMDQVPKEMYQ